MFHLILLIAALGLAVYLIETFIPMSPPFKTAIRIVAVVCLIFILLSAFGILGHDVPVPKF